jgi:hypothetical protein
MWRLLAFWLFAGVASLTAQTAQITGRIMDPSGSVVPDARVETTEASTNRHRVVTTNSRGYYTIPFLHPGTYELTVEKPGFQFVGRSGLNLEVNQVVRLDLALHVMGSTEEVTVHAAMPLLDHETSALGQVRRPLRATDRHVRHRARMTNVAIIRPAPVRLAYG